MPQQKSSIPYILIGLVVLVMIGVGVFIVIRRLSSPIPPTPPTTTEDPSFNPFGHISTTTTNNPIRTTSTSTPDDTTTKIPSLRLLSNTPVGGYGASTTASTTIVRWVDRGRGNIYEAHGDSSSIITLSNTVVPKVYNSLWTKKLTAFVGQTLESSSDSVNTIFAELRTRTPTTTASSSASSTSGSSFGTNVLQTPYELKGDNLPSNIVTYAMSPKGDKIFMLTNENGHGIGYISTIDGKSVTQIFDSLITQVTAEWPEDNTIAITTKASALQDGYLYFINPKTGVWTNILGPIVGLTTKVSHDAKYILVSTGGTGSVSTSIYNITKKTSVDAVMRTLADKCVWGNFNVTMLYCAVPTQITSGNYPDDWYSGILSKPDKIWQVNASSGEIRLVTSIVDQSDRVIDAFNLGMDPKDEYIYFMNKNDLSLWSFDLVQPQ